MLMLAVLFCIAMCVQACSESPSNNDRPRHAGHRRSQASSPQADNDDLHDRLSSLPLISQTAAAILVDMGLVVCKLYWTLGSCDNDKVPLSITQFVCSEKALAQALAVVTTRRCQINCKLQYRVSEQCMYCVCSGIQQKLKSVLCTPYGAGQGGNSALHGPL